MKIAFEVLAEAFSISRLPGGSEVPLWAFKGLVSSITNTPDELSILGETSLVPQGVKTEPGWRGIKLIGPFEFTEVGVLASFLNPLAAAGIGILAVSTFDTDYIFVKSDQLEKALAALDQA